VSVTFDEKLASLGAEVLNATVPAGNYAPAVVVGNIIFLAGQAPKSHSRNRDLTGAVGSARIGIRDTGNASHERAIRQLPGYEL
jgi:hypothetical protein